MKAIDFLPDIYRQRDALRRARIWWGFVVILFSGAIGASAGAQVWLRHGLRTQLDELEPLFISAQTQVRELADLQSQTVKAANEASLFTYIEHPWPRSQILADVVRSLPPSIRLTQIHISDEEMARSANQAGPRRPPGENEAGPKTSDAEQDLQKLQEEMDHRQTVVELDGNTADVAHLHEYLALLSRSSLIASASIKAMEATPGKGHDRTNFTLRLIVSPGFGQRGHEGPAPSPVPVNNHAALPANGCEIALAALGGGGL